MASSLKFACVVLMCMALVGAPMVQAINCGQVVSMVASCIPPITQGGTPAPGCCSGMRNLLKVAATTADRQAACNCLKTAARGIPGFNDKNAAALPGKCGVNVPYKISTSTNCATIKF